jgi:hypothetical protein
VDYSCVVASCAGPPPPSHTRPRHPAPLPPGPPSLFYPGRSYARSAVCPWCYSTSLTRVPTPSYGQGMLRTHLCPTPHPIVPPPLTLNYRYEPCPERGLSLVLLNLADSWRSPLNNPFDKLYLVLRPVRKKARALLHSIAAGKVRAHSNLYMRVVALCVYVCVCR